MDNLQESDLSRGQHLYTERMKGIYYHHGIVICEHDVKNIDEKFMSAVRLPLRPFMIIEENRNGLRVVDLEGFCNNKGPNRHHKMHRVRYGVPLEVYDKAPAGTCYLDSCVDEHTIIKNALLIFNSQQEQDIWKSYNVVFRNCEQFAYLCCTNFRTLGEQVNSIGKTLCFGAKPVATQMLKLFRGSHLLSSVKSSSETI